MKIAAGSRDDKLVPQNRNSRCTGLASSAEVIVNLEEMMPGGTCSITIFLRNGETWTLWPSAAVLDDHALLRLVQVDLRRFWSPNARRDDPREQGAMYITAPDASDALGRWSDSCTLETSNISFTISMKFNSHMGNILLISMHLCLLIKM